MENNKNNRTDLAREICGDTGVIRCEGKKIGDTVFTVEEMLLEGGKRYISISSSELISSLSVGASLYLSKLISKELCNIGELSCTSLAVIGLGNREMTVDSLGVRSAELIAPTRKAGSDPDGLSVIIPGTEASTGISAFEMLSAVFDTLKPNAAIAVDSLAAISADRLGRTFQIGNAGISPGSGIGRRKHRIDKSTLGIPVYSIGIPTVISANRFVYQEVGEERNRDDFFVALSQSDAVVESAARIIAAAIEEAFSSD